MDGAGDLAQRGRLGRREHAGGDRPLDGGAGGVVALDDLGSLTAALDEYVGDTADTAEFAVESIRRWWDQMGRARFPDAQAILITADAGGSNGYRLRTWKVQLARLAAETGLSIRCVTTLLGPPSGTGSSTACSASSP